MTPYCSPIYITSVRPLKSGMNLLRVEFWNLLYAEGVQDFKLDFKVLKRADNYMLVDLPYDKERSAIVGHIELSWLERFCPEFVRAHPFGNLGSVSLYLDRIFNGRSAP